jgi:DNA-binding NarL/FixJ family response regulator
VGTFWISQPETVLIGSMARALLLRIAPDASFLTESDVKEDFGGVRIELADTGRWLCLFSEISLHAGVAAALAAGASSVVTIDGQTNDFVRAVGVLFGAEPAFVPLDLLKWVAGQAVAGSEHSPGMPTEMDDKFVRLTERERQVLRLLAAGHSNREVAEALTISTNTVRSHLHALATKLDASSRTRILAKARALGLDEARGNDPRTTISA